MNIDDDDGDGDDYVSLIKMQLGFSYNYYLV